MLMPAEAVDAKDRLGAALGGHRRTVPHFRTGVSLRGGHGLLLAKIVSTRFMYVRLAVAGGRGEAAFYIARARVTSQRAPWRAKCDATYTRRTLASCRQTLRHARLPPTRARPSGQVAGRA